MSQFRMTNTKRADGVYITWHRDEIPDDTARPEDSGEPEYAAEDRARLEAWQRDEWWFIGIRARAEVCIVRNGTGVYHTLTSAGLWGIESDSGEDYFAAVFADEKAALLDDMRAFGTLPIVEC
jgi:hypothetical protein